MVLTGERTDVADCLDAMDVALHASMTPEPFGRVIVEAMARGEIPRENAEALTAMVAGMLIQRPATPVMRPLPPIVTLPETPNIVHADI